MVVGHRFLSVMSFILIAVWFLHFSHSFVIPSSLPFLQLLVQGSGIRQRQQQQQQQQQQQVWLSTAATSFLDDSDEYAYLEHVRAEMAKHSGTQSKWHRAAQLLADSLSIPFVQAEDCLAVALHWKRWAVVTSPTARKFVRTLAPDTAVIAASLQWLNEGPLGLQHPRQLRTAILAHPHVYLIAPSENYAAAQRVAPNAYRHHPDAFRALVHRDPSALQCTFNCAIGNDGGEDEDGGGGCQSECGNCWVSFERKF